MDIGFEPSGQRPGAFGFGQRGTSSSERMSTAGGALMRGTSCGRGPSVVR
jgi:hypothetical protein